MNILQQFENEVRSPGAIAWLWIPLVLFATVAQTARNAAQRSLTAEAGTIGATLARFLYALPLAITLVIATECFSSNVPRASTFSTTFFLWLGVGAVSQVAATAFLLAAMKQRNFVVAVTYSKTEILQVAVIGALVLHEIPNMLTISAMLLAMSGVVLLSLPALHATNSDHVNTSSSPAVTYGIFSGTAFALAAVGYRKAGLDLSAAGTLPVWIVSAWSVFWAQVLQSVLLTAWLYFRDKPSLLAVFRLWRVSMLAGSAGAFASFAWFAAYVLHSAAEVRTLGMTEVIFSYFVSRRFLKEDVSRAEKIGLALVICGVAAVCFVS